MLYWLSFSAGPLVTQNMNLKTDITDNFVSRRSVVFSALLAPPMAAMATVGDKRPELFDIDIRGSGSDVLLIPGLASSSKVWSLLVGHLSARHRIHLVDVAGFAGRPAAPNVAPLASNLADALANYIARNGLSNPTVVGHSFGGEVGLMLAARHPSAVGRLVVVDALPFYSLLFSPSATVETVAPNARGFRDAWLAATDEQLSVMHEASAARLTNSAENRAVVAGWSRVSDRRTIAEAAYELATTDLRPELPRIQAPTTVVYAHHPSYGAVDAVDGLFSKAYEALRSVRLLRVDNSRHFVMLDQPDIFNAVIAKVLG